MNSTVATPELKMQYRAHTDRITDMKEGEIDNKKVLYTASRDKKIKGWRFVQDGTGEIHAQLYRVYEKHGGFVDGIELINNGEYVVSIGQDKTIRMWMNGRLQKTVGCLDNRKPSCILYHAYHADQEKTKLIEYVFVGSEDGSVQMWNTKLEMKKKFVRPNYENVSVTAIHKIPKKPESIICAYADGTMIMWNIESEQIENTMKGHSTVINAIKASPDGSLCATAGRDRKILLWDIRGQNNSFCQIAINETVHCLDFASSAYWLALGTDNGIIIWDIVEKDILIEMAHPEGIRGPCTALFWVDQSVLAAGYADGSVQYSVIKK